MFKSREHNKKQYMSKRLLPIIATAIILGGCSSRPNDGSKEIVYSWFNSLKHNDQLSIQHTSAGDHTKIYTIRANNGSLPTELLSNLFIVAMKQPRATGQSRIGPDLFFLRIDGVPYNAFQADNHLLIVVTP